MPSRNERERPRDRERERERVPPPAELLRPSLSRRDRAPERAPSASDHGGFGFILPPLESRTGREQEVTSIPITCSIYIDKLFFSGQQEHHQHGLVAQCQYLADPPFQKPRGMRLNSEEDPRPLSIPRASISLKPSSGEESWPHHQMNSETEEWRCMSYSAADRDSRLPGLMTTSHPLVLLRPLHLMAKPWVSTRHWMSSEATVSAHKDRDN